MPPNSFGTGCLTKCINFIFLYGKADTFKDDSVSNALEIGKVRKNGFWSL